MGLRFEVRVWGLGLGFGAGSWEFEVGGWRLKVGGWGLGWGRWGLGFEV